MWDRINHGVAPGQEHVSTQNIPDSGSCGSSDINFVSATSYNGCWMLLERRRLKQSPNWFSM